MSESDNVPPADTTTPSAEGAVENPPESPVTPADPPADEATPVGQPSTGEQQVPAEPTVVPEQPVPAQQTEPAGQPELAEQPAPVDAGLAEAAGGGLTWIPYAIYLGLWIGLAAASVWLLADATADHPARWMEPYEPLVWAGVALAALGPVLSVAVWLVARARRPRGARAGLFASAMMRGAVTAFFGAVIWIGTLSALEVRASQGG